MADGWANDISTVQIQMDKWHHQVCGLCVGGGPWASMRECVRELRECVIYTRPLCVCVRSEDSDTWTMGARNWHAGYSTRSKKGTDMWSGTRPKFAPLGKCLYPRGLRRCWLSVRNPILSYSLFTIVVHPTPVYTRSVLYAGSVLRCGLEMTFCRSFKVSGGQRRRNCTMNSKVYMVKEPR